MVVSKGLGRIAPGQLRPRQKCIQNLSASFCTVRLFASTWFARHLLWAGQRPACPQFLQRVLTGDDAVPTSDADDLFSPVDPFTCRNVSGADSGLLPLNLKIAQQ